jgi:hypothetical protein
VHRQPDTPGGGQPQHEQLAARVAVVTGPRQQDADQRHLDRGDRVVGALGRHRHLAVVLQPDGHPIGQPTLGDQLLDVVALLGGDGDARGVHAVVLGGVEEEQAPAAADVEQAHARLQPQLPADHLQLVPLRLGDPVAAVGDARVGGRVLPEVGAGVGHVLVEQVA